MTTKNFDARGQLEYVRTTVADITYYVATTGLDTNDGLTAPTALLTIQEAINRVPKNIKHKVTIEVGAGNFGAFRVSGFSLSTWVGDGTDYQFTIRGAAFIPWTPATGLGSGTSTGGTTNTLIDAGGGWTAHDLRGKWVYVNSEWLIIRDNDATSLETIGISGSTMSGKAYVIQDHSTFINTKVTYAQHGVPGAATAATSGCIWLDNNIGERSQDSNGIHITRLQINSPATTGRCIHAVTSECTLSYLSVIGTYAIGILVYNTSNICLNRIYTGGTSTNTGVLLSGITRIAIVSNLFAYGLPTGISILGCGIISVSAYLYADYCTATGISIYAIVYANLSNMYCSYSSSIGIVIRYVTAIFLTTVITNNNTYAGICLYGISYMALTNVTATANKYGIVLNVTELDITTNTYIFGPIGIVIKGTVVLSSNTSYGIVCGANTTARLVATTGTGNGGYGIYAKLGAKVFFTSTTTITGSSGDVKVGITVGSYAVDFATDQSYINDLSEGTIVKRSDVITF